MKKSRASIAAVEKISATDTEAELAQNAGLFHARLEKWYQNNARDLPWRGVNDPYATWLSEIMLQQTRVAAVIDRYRRFLIRFPTLEDLAEAEESEVLALWSGLGYYRRARMLHRGAQFVVREFEGKLPRTAHELKTLPGVGVYTAAAIASIAFGQSIAVVDGNVERVLLRVMGSSEEATAEAHARIARAAQSLIPPSAMRKSRTNPPGDHNQAMMELGAMICLPKVPLCSQCPVSGLCRTKGEHLTRPREKQKSQIVSHLLVLRKAGTTTEVLLERRSESASLMPGMLELPELPIGAVKDREPVLRLRHAITNTNYYVQIFSEGAPATKQSTEGDVEQAPMESGAFEEELFVAAGSVAADYEPYRFLVSEVGTSAENLSWRPTKRLRDLPLTGLSRKVLQRLGVMPTTEYRVD